MFGDKALRTCKIQYILITTYSLPLYTVKDTISNSSYKMRFEIQ